MENGLIRKRGRKMLEGKFRVVRGHRSGYGETKAGDILEFVDGMCNHPNFDCVTIAYDSVDDFNSRCATKIAQLNFAKSEAQIKLEELEQKQRELADEIAKIRETL